MTGNPEMVTTWRDDQTADDDDGQNKAQDSKFQTMTRRSGPVPKMVWTMTTTTTAVPDETRNINIK